MAVGAISPTDDRAPHEVRSSIICLNTTLYMCKDMHFNNVHDLVPGRWSSAIIKIIVISQAQDVWHLLYRSLRA